MADNADIAAEIQQQHLEGALASRLPATAPVHATECDDCGSEIPTARREAAPWATTCIECQGIRERRAKHAR